MAMRSVTIEPKDRSLEHQVSALERALSGHAGRELTVADAVALSGIPLEGAEAALIQLAGRRPARLRVTERGELLFRFTPAAPASDHPTWRAFRSALGRFERRVVWPIIAFVSLLLVVPTLAVLFGNALAVPMVASQDGWIGWVAIPSLVFVAGLGLAFVMALGAIVVVPLLAVSFLGLAGAILVLLCVEPTSAAGTFGLLVLAAICAALGVPAARFSITSTKRYVFADHAWVRRLWSTYGGLLFGPRPELAAGSQTGNAADPLRDERRLTALIRARRGILCASDLIGLFRWSPAEADAALVRVLVDYGGDFHITDDGATLYLFPSLLRTTHEADLAPPEPLPATPPPHWLPWQKSERGLAFALLVAALWGAFGVLVLPDVPWLPAPGDWTALAERKLGRMDLVPLYGAGLWPYLAVLALPLARLPLFLARRLAWTRRRGYDALLAIAAEHPEGAPYARPNARRLAALGGHSSRPGWVAFPELARAKCAAEMLRLRVADKPDAELGRVVFASE